MSIQLSKAVKWQLQQLHDQAEEKGLFIEMRDKYGILLAVSTGLKSLTEEKDKNGKPLYRVDSKKVLNYDHIKEIVLYDVQLGIYNGKKVINYQNPKTQEFFDKQEQYWADQVYKFEKHGGVLFGSDVIVNRVNKLK